MLEVLVMNNDLLKTKEQLIRELESLRIKSKGETDKLLAANQQLAASEQQLRATNQQLSAGEQQLRATNQQLQTANQQLSASEKELKYQHDFLQKVIDAVPARIFWKDQNSVYLGCNKAFVNDCGKTSHQEVIGKNDDYMVWKADADVYRSDDQEVMNSKIPKLKYEEPFINKNGEQVVWRTSKVPLKNDIGEVIGLLATSENITEEKKAEAVIKQKQYHLENAQELGKIGSWDLDIEKNELIWTNETYRILGIPIGTPMNYELFLSRIHPDDLDYVDKKWNAAMRGDEAYDINHRLLMDDGEVKWVREKAELVFDNNGKCLRGTGFTQDVTGRIQAEEKLMKSESSVRRKLTAIAEPDGDLGNLLLSDVIDADSMQSLLKKLAEMTGMCTGIADLEGNILASAGWRDACSQFHRKHPETLRHCLESDTILSKEVAPGDFKLYKCKNHLWESASPLTIANQHVGNIYMGQFLYEDEQLDLQFFKEQAKKCEFNEIDYLAAVKQVPRFNKEKVENAIQFFAEFAEMVSAQSYNNIRLTRALSQVKRSEKSAKHSEKQFRELYNQSPIAIQYYDAKGNLIDVNKKTLEIYGLESADEIASYNFLRSNKLSEDNIRDLKEGKSIYIPDVFDFEEIKKHKYFKTERTGILYVELLVAPVLSEGETIAYLVHMLDVTEQKQANNKIKASEEKFRGVFEDSNVGIAIGSSQGDVLEVNEEYLKITGYSRNEFLGLNYADFTHPEELQKESILIEELKKGERENFRIEKRVKAKNGSYLWLDTAITGQRKENGELDKLIIMVIDITEAKKATETVNVFFDQPMNIHLIGSIDGQILKVNRGWEETLGYTKVESVGKNIFDFVHPDDKEYTLNELSELQKGKTTFYFENRYKHKNGTFVTLAWSAIFNTSGKMLHGVAKDITQQKAYHEQLVQSEERYKALSENANHIILTHNFDGKITYANQFGLDFMNLPKEQVIGTDIKLLVQNIEDLEKMQQRIKDFMSGDFKVHQYELNITLPSGDKKILEVIGSPIKLNNKIDSVLLTAYDITEREKSRLELADSETKLKNIIENSTNLFYTHTVDNKITFVSPRVKEFLGYEPEEVMENWTDFITDNPINRKAFENTDKAIQTGQRQPTYEIEMQRKDGKKIIVEVREAPVVVNGEVESIVGSLADITERKKSENKLRESEEKLRLAIDNSPLGITINDMEGNFVSVNKAYEKMVGYSKDELQGMKFFDLTHPDYLPKNRELFDNMATNKEPDFVIEKKYIHKNGKLIDVRIHAGSIKDENGKPLFGMALTEDITERIKAEENILSISRRLQLSTESANIGIWEFDLKKNVLNWDSRMFELYGITPDNFGSTYDAWQKGVHPDDRKRTDKETQDAIAGIKDFHTQFRVIWPNGQVRHVEAHAIVTRDQDDKPKSMIGVNWDITAIKNTEINLINAKLKAEESDRLKSAFLSNMSHEIRTPMNGILGFTSLLKEPQLTGDTRDKYIQIIEKSGNRMLNTINDIVDISKIEAGQVEVSKKELSVNKLLDEQFNFFIRETEAKGLELIYKPMVSDRDSQIISDQHKLNSILTNLIKNAIKFTVSGSITFGYTIKSVEGKDVCEFYVKDTGIGIPANRLEAIFNRFEQADIEDTRVFEGSGLGLAISKSYVEMLGGTITVSSEEGNGSTFTFNIPCNKQNHKESGSNQNSEEGFGVSLKNLSIIVAEDDEVSKILLKTILEKEYSKIIYTSTGNETIDKCRENPDTDIILMDIKMPGMNGFSATKLIREFNQDVIIIAQTAYGLTGDKEKAIEVGCDDYIAKPIKKDSLLEKIQLCLNKKRI